MKSAVRTVKIYACNAATSNSKTDINKANKIDAGPINRDLNIKTKEIKLRIMMCPAVMLAKSRIIKAKGFVSIPSISTGINIGFKSKGTPGGLKI